MRRPRATSSAARSPDSPHRGGLARAIRADEPEDTAFFDTQIDAIQRDRRAESLAEAASFYACHGFSVSPWGDSAWWISTARHPRTAGWSPRSGVLPLSGRAAEWWRESWAILRQETFGARPAARDSARH